MVVLEIEVKGVSADFKGQKYSFTIGIPRKK